MKTETMNFEDFCATHGEISDKATGNKVALKLNGAQRHVVHYLEKCRVAGIPCRLLILKSRQLGISTVLQYYFTWLLLFHCEMETFLSLCHNKQLSLSFINSMMKIYTSYNKDQSNMKFLGRIDSKMRVATTCSMARHETITPFAVITLASPT